MFLNPEPFCHREPRLVC